MSRIEIIEKPLPALRLAARTAVAADQAEIGVLVGPMFDAIAAVIGDECGSLATPIAQYLAGAEGMHLTVGYVYSGPPREGIEVIELPAVASAMCGVHLGAMDGIGGSWMALHDEIVARGLAPSGACRELYLRAESDDQSDWVTELQQPVASA
ncbi:MAG: GyrI-like domain-containing protein [Microbacterium sp.]